MKYPDKNRVNECVDYVEVIGEGQFRELHPTDKATSYRAIETWAGDQAKQQEDMNAERGVPERGQDG